MRIALLLLAVLSLVGCGGPNCTVNNCNGCCDAHDSCQAGTVTDVCGIGGKLCVACPSQQECSSNACRPKTSQSCNASSCGGCCDSTGACQVGNSPSACGTGGAACSFCGSPLTCTAGACR